MKDTAICIITRGRAKSQITLNNLPTRLLKSTYLVIEDDEYKAHKKYTKKVKEILRFPSGWGNFDGCSGDKKEWVKNHLDHKYLFFIDDDATFCIRESGKIKKASNFTTHLMFKVMRTCLKNDNFAQVAISPRGGNNRVPEDYRDNTRGVAVVGFNTDLIKKHSIKFNRLLLMSDFDTTLQILTKGLQNRTYYCFAFSTIENNAEGGCSAYRTPKAMKQAAHSLKTFHPQFVKIVEKKSAKAWHGFKTNTRTDVQVSWRKAYKFSSAKKSKGISTFLKKR